MNLQFFKQRSNIEWRHPQWLPVLLAIGATAVLLLTTPAHAATTTGTVLQPTFTLLNDLIGGYGMRILTVVCFAAALIALVSLRGFAPVLGFIGFAIFGGVGLAMALALTGAII